MFRHRDASDFSAEIEAHVQLEADRLEELGFSPEYARSAALRAFGNMTRVRERWYESGRCMWLEDCCQDLRYALRILLKNRAFSLVAVLTLALGVGANTAMFSIVNAVLLRPLPFRDSAQLVRVFFNDPGLGLRDMPASKPELDDLLTRANVFQDVTPVGGGSVNLTGAKEPQRLEFIVTYPTYFSILGAVPQIGRLFGAQDAATGFAPVVVISDSLWRHSFGADASVIGRTVRLDNDAYTIIGVLQPNFYHPGVTITGNVDVFAAAGFTAEPFPRPVRANRSLNPGTIARLKPGLTIQEAQARLTAMAAELRRDFPADYPAHAERTIEIQPLQDYLVGNVRPMLLVLLGAVTLIILLVSLNIANLLLARASGRQQEMALRMALGAPRGRLVRQVLTESMLLSAIGGLAGVAAAIGMSKMMVRFLPASIPRINQIRVDWVVLGFALAISVVTGLLFGLAPALRSAGTAPASAIGEATRGSGYGVRTGRLRDGLIISELAFAVVLMVGAGLLLRTLHHLLTEDVGFNPVHVVTAKTWLPIPNDPETDPYRGNAKKNVFYRELLRRMRSIPGVELAALTTGLPTTNLQVSGVLDIDALAVEGRPSNSSEDLRAERIRVTTDYFDLMQAPLLRGRFFSETDDDGKPAVAVIDETTARRYWGVRDPVGRRLRFGQDPTQPWISVVGVVKDIKSDGLDVDGVPHIYLPIDQTGARALSIVLRTSLPASVLEPQIQAEVQKIDPGLPVFDVLSMNNVLNRSLASRRFSADLVSGFAGIALLLSCIGIYGLLAYMVAQRSREISVRMALGARREDVLRLFLLKGAMLGAMGAMVGLLFSTFTASMMASLIYGVRPLDPTVFVTVPAALLAVTLLASYIPAQRATTVDPMVALRQA